MFFSKHSVKMASNGEEEVVAEVQTGRRTRSGRKVSAPQPQVVSPRTTRRSKKISEMEQIIDNDQVIEVLSETEPEIEHSFEKIIQEADEDEKSSSFPFGDMPSEITNLFEQTSVDKEDNSFFANLAAEENANSLPSAADIIEEIHDYVKDENLDEEKENSQDFVQESGEENILDNIKEDSRECQLQEQECESEITELNVNEDSTDVAKESGSDEVEPILRDTVTEDSNDNAKDEGHVQNNPVTEIELENLNEIKECVLNELNDNMYVSEKEQISNIPSIDIVLEEVNVINEIPMEVDEEPTKAQELTEELTFINKEMVFDAQDKITILEGLSNVETSVGTKNDLDAEMISEDELPTAVKPEVKGAEEVSDEELPGPQPKPEVKDAEEVSDEELPAPEVKPEVKDAEEVSDEELPGPKLAELPADTEVVSEDELPSSKKDVSKRKVDEGYDPGSPTETDDLPVKKSKPDVDAEPDVEIIEVEKKKKLPELDKYWKAVKDDPADFTGWTYLLQYVDQENDIEAAREAYDAFLSHYPYCYGYWRKYADYEKRKGNKKKCEEVFERGLKAIPLSVDLWIHYLAHVKTNYVDEEATIRTQFERALDACGLEFRSDKLWEAYIKWESEGKRMKKVVDVYDRLLITPTQGYNNHFDSFQEIVTNNTITSLISTEEIVKLRTEVRESLDVKEKSENEIPPGADEPDDHFRNEEEITAIKDKILAFRRKLHKSTVGAVTERWSFEEGIKRPYFHVKPLERCQLKNWKEYLDFEIEKGDRKRILVLFERCLIACALYDEFWLKLIRYLESQNDESLEDTTRDAFERACKVHHPDKPSLHLMWSAFEELHNDFHKALEILINIEKTNPTLLQIAYRRINIERRRKDFDKCIQLYEFYINQTKNKTIASSLAIKYARFIHKLKGDIESALNILKSALENDPSNARLVLQMIDLALQRVEVNEEEIVNIMDSFMARENMEPDQKVLFAQRKVEFLEDFGSTAKGLQDAQRTLQIALSKANDAKKKQSESTSTKKAAKEASNPPLPQSGSAPSNYSSSAYNYASNPNSSNYYYGNSQPAATGYQSYGDYGANSWGQYSQSGYSGYQWSGYGNYY